MAMATLRFLNVPINLLVHREEGDIALHYFEHRGGSSPFRIIDPAEELGGMLAMMAVLKKGEVLCTMGDRVFGSSRNTVAVCFLGADIRVPFSAFKIASATGSPIAVMFSVRQASGRYELMLDRVIRVPADLGRSGAEFACYAGEFVQGMEAYVKDHPFQFFNFFDMWERDDLSGTEPRTSSLEKTEGKRR